MNQEIKVLDKGFVRLVDTMGNDSSIVQAARISYGAGTKTPSDDRSLIRYLMRHRHTTPFEMCEAKFHVKVPMDHWRQWIRHRTANVNEYSTRYSEAIDEMQETSNWRKQSKSNKQGSDEILGLNEELELCRGEKELQTFAILEYKKRLEYGVAREQARKDLPLSTYTEAYWKIDLHNLFHFLSLRMDSYAQLEIRSYANAMAEIVKEWVPIAWEAFVDYRLEAITFSKYELEILKELFRGGNWYIDKSKLGKREILEFQDKLKDRLGIDL